MAQVLFLSLAITCLLFRLSAPTGIRLQLTHVDAKLNLTKTELSRRGVERSKHRVASLTWSLASTGNNVQAPLHWAQASYQIDIAIGTPSIPLTVIADTGSDLIWTQCAPCQCFPQPNAIYDPSKSNTFSKLECSSPLCQSLPSDSLNCDGTDCGYFYGYVDGSYTKGLVASETFTFGSVSVPGVAFGCGRMNNISITDGSAGIVGLGRDPLSLVSQLGAGKFSYCLTSYGESRTSPLLIGSLASLSGAAQSTPLLQNPYDKSFYYLSLQGISVGSTLLPIPSTVFALNSDGSGGMVIDSGSTFTSLVYQGYEILKREFQSQVALPVADGRSSTGFDLCFSYPSDAPLQAVSIPKLVFHFDGADMELPQSNYMIRVKEIGMLCLAIMEADGTSVLGGFQQQNMHVLYDLTGNALSFAAAQCDQL